MGEQDASKQGSAPPLGLSDYLALERSYQAVERTLMAWIRTSLALIGFGFTIAQFFEFLRTDKLVVVTGPMGTVWGPVAVGRFLVGMGILALVLSVVHHRQTINSLRRHGLGKRHDLSLFIAALLGLLGVFTFIVMVFNA